MSKPIISGALKPATVQAYFTQSEVVDPDSMKDIPIKLNKPTSGTVNWHIPINKNFKIIGRFVSEATSALGVTGAGDYETPKAGELDWDEILNRNFRLIEEDLLSLAGEVDVEDVGGYELPEKGQTDWDKWLNNIFYKIEDDMRRIKARIHEGDNPTDGDVQDAVFISHASEDKEGFVKPLAHELRELGVEVWYDDFELKIGDSIRREIDRGLADSSYGIVVLSEHFFEKNWPQRELDALAEMEADGKMVILPVWYGVDKALVNKHIPTISGKLAAKGSEENVAEVAQKLCDVVQDRSPDRI